MLDSLDQIEAYDNIYHLETIGYSTQENLPIKAVKISDNADMKEDEGRVLFLGQCHAEEILGVETVIELITLLLDPPPAEAQHVNILRQSLEIWIVPTHNPEGLNVVHSGLDVSYRKNKTDFSPAGPYPNGIFDYDPSIGNDIDGVDLNRNYDFNWVFGDTFTQPDPTDYAAHFDYFGGTAPWSESEIVAIRDLALENDFLFSIAWHSSRSGRLSEKVYTSWKWDDAKFPPDTEELITIGDIIASRIVNEIGVANYESKYGTSMNGKAHDWFYQATGCFQYLIECATANLQPDSALIEDTIDRLMPAQFYLMDRAIGYNENAGQITGIVRGADGNPIEDVEVIVAERNGRILEPRLTDEFGRFRRILNPNTYTLRFRKFGYEETVIQATANNSIIYYTDILLNPKPMHEISFVIDEPWNDIRFRYDNGIFSGERNANQIFMIPEGEWELSIHIMDEGITVMPWVWNVNIESDLVFTPEFPNQNIIQFDLSDSSEWNGVNGNWNIHDHTIKTNETFIYRNSDSTSTTWILESDWLDVSGSNKLVLDLLHKYELEWDHDSISISLWDAHGILSKKMWTDQYYDSTVNEIIWAYDSSGFDSVKIQLTFDRDGSVAYRGWIIENMKLYHAHVEELGVQSELSTEVFRSGKAGPVYPNPSTGMIAIDLEQWQGPVEIKIYNLLGQEVYDEHLILSPNIKQQWRFDLKNSYGTQLSSGIYFIQLTGKQKEFIRKCVFLKQ